MSPRPRSVGRYTETHLLPIPFWALIIQRPNQPQYAARDNPLDTTIRTASCLNSSVCFFISSVSLCECYTLKSPEPNRYKSRTGLSAFRHEQPARSIYNIASTIRRALDCKMGPFAWATNMAGQREMRLQIAHSASVKHSSKANLCGHDARRVVSVHIVDPSEVCCKTT